MMTMLKRGIAYTALALSVTVGGVIIGAAVIAPMVSPAAMPTTTVSAAVAAETPAASAGAAEPSANVVAAPTASAPTVTAPAGPNAVSVMAARGSLLMQSMYAASRRWAVNATVAVSRYVSSRQMPQLEPRVWLAIAIGASLMVVSLVGWRYRSSRAARQGKGAPAFLMPTDKPMAGKPAASIVVAMSNRKGGRVDRTPRAVMALAESGAGISEIARRTGLPLDAVAMCLSMSTMGVRQLQPPTA